MPLSYPQIDELIQNAVAEFRQRLPSIDPTVKASWSDALVSSNGILAGVIADLVKQLEKQLFPQTATDEFLDRWGAYNGLERLAESSSVGLISVTGASGVGIVPIGTRWTAANGIEYESSNSGSIVERNFSVTSITRVSSTATVTTPSDHLLATGQDVTVSGADQPEYNGTFTITVTKGNQFTYQVTGAPATPATGTIIYTTSHITISVFALTAGSDGNLESGAVMTINTPINGVDDDALVQIDGTTGGEPEEEDDPYRTRILLARSIQEGIFTPDQIRLAALGINGNTRVYVKQPSDTIVGSTAGYAVQGALPANPTVEYVSVAPAASINISGNFTLSFWLKMFNDGASATDRTLVSKQTAVSNGWIAKWDPSTRTISFGNTTGGFSTFVLPLSLEGQWVNVTAVLSSSNNKLYINGVLKDDQTGYALADSGASIYMLGDSAIANSGIVAHMDEVRVYDALLNDDEVLFLYQRGTSDLANLQGYWQFTEGTGTTSADGSGNGNTATLTSTSLWVAGPGQNTPGMIPVPGQVVVYVLRDGDPNIIPSQTILDATKIAVIENGKKPAHMYEGDVFVLGPEPVEVDFTFSSIDPDTNSMRDAITAQLQSFFEDNVEFEAIITEANYLGAIGSTFDTVEGVRLKTFTLTAPTADVAVGNGAIGLLGTVTFT